MLDEARLAGAPEPGAVSVLLVPLGLLLPRIKDITKYTTKALRIKDLARAKNFSIAVG